MTRCRAVFFAGMMLCLLILCCLPAARAGSVLTVSLPATVKGYTPCEIVIESPSAGEAELRLFDRLNNPWLIRRETIAAGVNRLPWDGLGANRERMMAGTYHFSVRVTAEDGSVSTASASFEISGTTPSVVYALPSSDTLYLDGKERWFAECYVTAECIVTMEVRRGEEIIYSREWKFKDPDGETVFWNGTIPPDKRIGPGDYTVIFRSKLNPAEEASFPLRVAEAAPALPEIGETGPVLPERGMTDEEAWAVMMKPSVVIRANGKFLRYPLYSQPKKGREAASLRGATQGLEITGIEGAWAHVRAWDHEDGKPKEGYLLLKTLTVYRPSDHYAVVIDKREQTLTVWEYGHPIGTVPVSTGLPIPGNQYRETPAGAFLTDVHFGASFAQEGYRYEYPLRYDAGNMIHGLGYVRGNNVRDYSDNLPLLGQKASHGCTRVSLFADENCPINMYWLWSHLPYHTRVIVLDD